MIPLTGEGQNGIRPTLDTAGDHAGEMNAEKGEIGIGNGVDQRVAQMPGFGLQFEVFASEGNDLRRRFPGRHLCDTVGVEARAVYKVIGVKLPGSRYNSQLVVALDNFRNLRAGDDGMTGLAEQLCKSLTNLNVIDDPRLRYVNGFNTVQHVRLNLQQALSVDHLAVDAVGSAAFKQVVERRQLLLVGGNDDLAHQVEGDTLLFTELLHHLFARAAGFGFERVGFVINPRM